MTSSTHEGAQGPHHASGAALVALEAIGIVKRFPGVLANDDVNFDIRVGEVHTLLGENGAGKSTLASMLCGLYQPDAGRILRNGVPIQLSSPRAGLQHGIAMVHQHFRLVDRFSVAENVVLGSRDLSFKLNRAELNDAVAAVADTYGLPVDPTATVGDLSVGQRQRVEIVKALYQGAEILLLDEPTAVLVPAEVEKLFENVHAMTKTGKSVVFISHKLGEVARISDRVTVLRNGRVTGHVSSKGQADAKELARLMVGRDIDLAAQRASHPIGHEVLQIRDVSLVASGVNVLSNISFNVHEGEMVGIAGVAGNGQRELADVIAGLLSPTSGTISIGGAMSTDRGPIASRELGLAYVPEDRLGVGLVPSMSILDNLLLTRDRSVVVDRANVRPEANRLIDEFEIKANGPEHLARKLSGGNAQKVLLARELSGGRTATKLLVVCSPTRGLDVGAIETVRRLLDDARSAGQAILLISEDLDEIMSLADRVLVIYRGAIVHETPGATALLEQVGAAMAGLSQAGGA
ncbi:MAG: ABC transporter ATP-binding protein [Actinobacteria bacterium]|nr:ABC transporter ATP-binding protein [Actinomycetota bacterium]